MTQQLCKVLNFHKTKTNLLMNNNFYKYKQKKLQNRLTKINSFSQEQAACLESELRMNNQKTEILTSKYLENDEQQLNEIDPNLRRYYTQINEGFDKQEKINVFSNDKQTKNTPKTLPKLFSSFKNSTKYKQKWQKRPKQVLNLTQFVVIGNRQKKSIKNTNKKQYEFSQSLKKQKNNQIIKQIFKKHQQAIKKRRFSYSCDSKNINRNKIIRIQTDIIKFFI